MDKPRLTRPEERAQRAMNGPIAGGSDYIHDRILEELRAALKELVEVFHDEICDPHYVDYTILLDLVNEVLPKGEKIGQKTDP